MANGARFTTPELSELDRRICRGRRTCRRPGTDRLRAIWCAAALDHAGQARGLRRRACVAGRRAIGGEAGGAGYLVPSRRHRRRRIPDPRRPPSGGGSRTRRPCRLRAQPLRPVARPARAAADRAEHGREVYLSAAERTDRRAGAGRPAGAGGIRAHRRGGPAVLAGSAPPTTWRAAAPPSWSR